MASGQDSRPITAYAGVRMRRTAKHSTEQCRAGTFCKGGLSGRGRAGAQHDAPDINTAYRLPGEATLNLCQ